MAKRTVQELGADILKIFRRRRWSPLSAQTVLSRDTTAYDPPDDADMLAAVAHLETAGDIVMVFDEDDMKSVYVTKGFYADDSQAEPGGRKEHNRDGSDD